MLYLDESRDKLFYEFAIRFLLSVLNQLRTFNVIKLFLLYKHIHKFETVYYFWNTVKVESLTIV